MLAVDQQWPGEADGDLGDAEEVLDVAGQALGRHRVVPHVVELDAGLLAHEVSTPCGQFLGVVVFTIARNAVGASGGRR